MTTLFSIIAAKQIPSSCRNEDGYALIISLIFLVLLTILGMASTSTSIFELQISSNDRSRRGAFYAAEAGRAYVEANSTYYSSSNIINEVGAAVSFPDDPNIEWLPLNNSSSVEIKGKVLYVGSMNPPRGSGFAANSVRAHVYKMTCDGRDKLKGAQKSIEAGFYRIGL